MNSQIGTSKFHYRHILLFEFNKGSTAAEAVQTICQVYGEGTVNERMAQRMFARFGDGIFHLKDVPHICDDIWLDCFRLLAVAKVGLALALVSDRLDVLVDTHLRSRKWALGNFQISKAENGDGTAETVKWINGKRKWMPIPREPMPNGVIAFEELTINYINWDVVAFLNRFRRLFDSASLAFGYCWDLVNPQNWHIFSTVILPLLNVSTIFQIQFENDQDFHNFRSHIFPTFLRDCQNLCSIGCTGVYPQFPPDESDTASDGQALCHWLHTPRADGRPKVFFNYVHEQIASLAKPLKQAFLSAVSSVSFFIVLSLRAEVIVTPFELENWRTRERLKLWKGRQTEYDSDWLFERSPMKRNSAQWAEWAREAMYGSTYWRKLEFDVYNETICLPIEATTQNETINDD
ncbi:hypothetical protein niasHT_038813 [Heterodera trifolii]|uniref:Mos1 transposase HTH domain-containing protein n=1 Tax=Heterodera trifolii TaxID=157864 RepID=A0ABD2IDW2_9BILA